MSIYLTWLNHYKALWPVAFSQKSQVRCLSLHSPDRRVNHQHYRALWDQWYCYRVMMVVTFISTCSVEFPRTCVLISTQPNACVRLGGSAKCCLCAGLSSPVLLRVIAICLGFSGLAAPFTWSKVCLWLCLCFPTSCSWPENLLQPINNGDGRSQVNQYLKDCCSWLPDIIPYIFTFLLVVSSGRVNMSFISLSWLENSVNDRADLMWVVHEWIVAESLVSSITLSAHLFNCFWEFHSH